MGSRPDYYRILHVQDDAPLEIIRASYRTLMRTMGAHPDLGGDENGARALNEAWEVLSDQARRARYDAERSLGDARVNAPEPAPEPDSRDDARSERRAVTRLAHDARITWTTEEGESSHSRIRDLSPRGLSFVACSELRPDTPLQIASDALNARGIVRNIRRIDDECFLVGVEFLQVRFHDRRGTFLSRSA